MLVTVAVDFLCWRTVMRCWRGHTTQIIGTCTAGSLHGSMADAAKKRTPTDFLNSVIGRPVVVKLNSGVDYRGIILANALLRFGVMIQADSRGRGPVPTCPSTGCAKIKRNCGACMTASLSPPPPPRGSFGGRVVRFKQLFFRCGAGLFCRAHAPLQAPLNVLKALRDIALGAFQHLIDPSRVPTG